jgi:hypothetical protein
MTAIEADCGPVDRVERVQFREQQAMQAVPDMGIGPALEPAPACHPGPEPEFLGQVSPVDAGIQYEQDALQAFQVVERRRAALAGPVFRQQHLDTIPQRIVNLPRPTHALVNDKIQNS